MAATSSAQVPMVLNKAAIVHAPEFDVGCVARLRIAYDQSANRGSISIRLTVDLGGPNPGRRMLMLNIRPAMVDTCVVASRSNDSLIPSHILDMIPAPVTNSSAVATLTLCLNTTGILLAPSDVDILSPANRSDMNFYAFSKICRSNTIHLHLSTRVFAGSELVQLQGFSNVLCDHALEAEHMDYSRLNAGRGMKELHWRSFDQSLDPPSYCDAVASDAAHGKRPRDSSSSSPNQGVLRKRLAPPTSPLPGSPTELNTPSIRTLSPPQFSPTKFAHAASPEHKDRADLVRIQQKLKDMPDHLIRQLLAASGHQHLLATASEEKDVDASVEAEKVTMAKVDEMIELRLNDLLDERLGVLTRDAFKSLTQTRLQRLVKVELPVAADMFLNAAVSEYRDRFQEDCKMSEVNFRGEVDEGITEVRQATSDCLQEIEELVQQYLDNIEEHGNKLHVFADEEITKFKRWSVEVIQSSLDRKASPDHASTSTNRRSSM